MALLASGAFVALLPLGLAIASTLGVNRARDAAALALPLAIGAMSIPMTAAALAGHFSTASIGAGSWLLLVFVVAFLLRARAKPFDLTLYEPTAWRRARVAGVLALAAIIYALGVSETPLGSRDEGVYTLAGLALERAGTAEIAALPELARASGLFEPFASGIVFHLPGIPEEAHLRPQFSPLLPAWIAQLHAVGGDALLYRFNVLAAIACGGVFYALARRVLRRSYALLALLVFALNPAEVWIARINLAEPLGALFALAGLLLAVPWTRSCSRATGIAAVALLALAAMVRVDTIIVAPLLIAAAVAFASRDDDRTHADALGRLGVFALAGQTAAIAVLGFWAPSYVIDHLRLLLLAPAAAALAVAAYAIVRRRPAPPPHAKSRTLVAATLCAIITSLFLYASLVRPHVEPFALISERYPILAGMRDFRENSLRDIASYVGWPTVVLALVGALAAVRRATQRRGSLALIMLCIIGAGTAVVYLSVPNVSPDHPWAIRRMTTLVIPLIILIAAYGVQCLLHATVGWRQRRLPPFVALVAAASMLALQWPTLRLSENAGLTTQLRHVDAALPAGPIVVRGYEGLATTLALGFGRDVLPLRDELVSVNAASRAFWAACRPCTLLHASYEGLDGLQLDAARTFQLSREYVAPTFHPLAQALRHETLNVLVSQVTGIAAEAPPPNAGAARDWRVDDRGFRRDELAPGTVARWTDGDAAMMIRGTSADGLEIRLASAAPGLLPLRIELDGVPRFDGVIGPGEARWRLSLDRADATHWLTLHSSTFVPAAVGNDRDRRLLGVSVRAVRLLDSPLPPLLAGDSPASDFRSRLTLRRTGLNALETTGAALAFRVDIDNRGAAVWPAASEAVPGAPSVGLGYYWTRTGDSRRLNEQRIAMPYSLRPHEHWSTALVLDFDDDPLRQLAAGDYELHVGLVLEGIAWFADRGDAATILRMTVVGR